ncbi:hypothetical protein JJL56_31680 [Azospirillum sp. YIM DDC1]|uniref:Uncharacterized protein n=1 Tax=Azospirillum aestuarii TaxID=2802052 RepID=A0ABS1I8L7_9PROT|nr:hypothetical protein [Azospirillum aestuarii]MBK4723414.1 hypothetical protein [Azospirillum aestuarii]
MSTKRMEMVGDLLRHGVYLQVTCECGHVRRFDGAELLERFGYGGSVSVIRRASYRCTRCRSTRARTAILPHSER